MADDANAAVVELTIRIGRDAAGEIDRVCAALEALGLEAIERRDRFLIVNARGPRSRLDAVRAIDGVASVREAAVFKPV